MGTRMARIGSLERDLQAWNKGIIPGPGLHTRSEVQHPRRPPTIFTYGGVFDCLISRHVRYAYHGSGTRRCCCKDHITQYRGYLKGSRGALGMQNSVWFGLTSRLDVKREKLQFRRRHFCSHG